MDVKLGLLVFIQKVLQLLSLFFTRQIDCNSIFLDFRSGFHLSHMVSQNILNKLNNPLVVCLDNQSRFSWLQLYLHCLSIFVGDDPVALLQCLK